ncbi:MAG: SAM-dependent methyltransferase [Candidatus Binatia bacterium]
MPAPRQPQAPLTGAAADRIIQRFPSFCDFVDDALFHPGWGYYSGGGVRFGAGGHFDTYPLALSPLFGRMVAEYAFKLWRRRGTPAAFEICELGAGNGQLCLDTVLWIHERARHERPWQRFAEHARYRIVERSTALVERQRRLLGPLAGTVRWTRGDAAQRALRGTPFGPLGLVVANEVLDCLPHHKVIAQPGAAPAVAFVVPEEGGRALSRARLAARLATSVPPRLRYREVLVCSDRLPALRSFLRRHYPELDDVRRPAPPLFVCPRAATLLGNAARFYEAGEALWADYGETRPFHLRAAEPRKVFAGPPRSGASVFDRPGRDDITFMVDFSLAAAATAAAGWPVVFYGPQGELAQRSGVALDRAAVDLIVRHRALTWMLAVAGVDPESEWRRDAVGWSGGAPTRRVSVQGYAQRSVDEFVGRRRTTFKVMITSR